MRSSASAAMPQSVTSGLDQRAFDLGELVVGHLRAGRVRHDVLGVLFVPEAKDVPHLVNRDTQVAARAQADGAMVDPTGPVVLPHGVTGPVLHFPVSEDDL